MRGLAEIKRDNAGPRSTPIDASLLTVDCKHCGATGRRALTHTEWVTLDAITFGWMPTAEIRERLGRRVQATALANRLAEMERNGLVEHRVCAMNHRIK